MTTPRLLLINPNTTAAMTQAMVAQIAAHLGERAQVQGATAAFGHPVIASRVSYAIGAHAALDALARHAALYDAVILGCFGDPGLEALREATAAPVIGLAEAAFHAAATLGAPFGVLTVGPAWRAMLLERLALHPAGGQCRDVMALDGTGLDFAGHPAHLVAELDAAATTLLARGAATIILGGAALAGLAPRLRTPARFVDCVLAAADQAMAASACAAIPGASIPRR